MSYTTLLSVDTGEIPGKTDKEQIETLKSWYSCNLDEYYNDIRDYTFRSDFIDITADDAKLWLQYNRRKLVTNKEIQIFDDHIKKPLQKAILQYCTNSSSNQTNNKLTNGRYSGTGGGAFVRLSTRSPKDAVDKPPLADKLNKLLDIQLNGAKDANDHIIAVRRAFFKCMKVTSVEEALLLISFSSRTISDLKRALVYYKKTGIWTLKIVGMDIMMHALFY